MNTSPLTNKIADTMRMNRGSWAPVNPQCRNPILAKKIDVQLTISTEKITRQMF